MEKSTLKTDDYLQQYRNISAKLRKRFLRKPNVAEASDEFDCLQRRLCDSGVWQGAGLSCLAVARCQQTLANRAAEGDALTRAARSYVNAEQASSKILCPSFGDHLLTSSSCYRRAIGLYNSAAIGWKPTNPGATEDHDTTPGDTAAAALSLELSRSLQRGGREAASVTALQGAVETLQHCPVQQQYALQQLQHCYIRLGELGSALQTSVRLLELPQSNTRDRHQCEVSSLLLLLVLQPPPLRTPPVLQQLLQRGASPTGSLDCLLACLVEAVRGKDREAMGQLVADLTPLLHHLPYHLHLLHLLQHHDNTW